MAAGGAGLVATADPPVLDSAARNAYQRRLAATEAELDRADRSGDAARAARAQAERDAIVKELRRATGRLGSVRQTSGEAERARVNVTRTLRATIDRIADKAPQAGAHLQASIRTGRLCRYDPAPGGPIRWRI